ncbi:RND transporter [Beijerinckiaceae bacterium RH AL1]|nr:efflux RND transporter permease subunit [Beijerinckiaceae bacterium]VVB46922.1 RND transporter [Beijerinckiaceae bacterium RH CH11]VVB47005.1 RND transporter [Beijerinckiaceae bacterium RH AL8]VVC55626.1 RND transporter [Beijerinckiaceae bacterium RH AL1]
MLAIVRIALSRPYTFVVMAMLILIFGVMAWKKTPTDIFPNIGIPVVSAVWTYNGLPPDEMSGRIIYYYERTLSSQVNDIQHIESQSLSGYGVVKVFFQPTVDINTAIAQITAASQTVLKLLPPGVTPPYVLVFNASSVPILQLALSSTTVSQTALADVAQNFIRPQLATVAGAAVPSPYGGKVRQVQVDLDPKKLEAYRVSATAVTNALAQENLITPVGTQKIGEFEYVVALNDAPKAIAELNDLPIKSVDHTVVYIRDVAFVHDGSPPQTNIVHVDGKNAVLMTIQKAGSASTLDVINGVKALLPKIEAGLPPGIVLTAVGDQSAFVNEAVSGVLREGIIAAALTGLMILVFLGSWRSTLIITISIPLAILFSVAVLSVLGETINVMTLGGLALAVGILVDDATVTIENINWHLEQGKATRDAIMDGARQIVLPATVSLLCICIVFVPMFSLGGVAGFLFKPMAEAVIFALIGSYILSRTLVPTIANYLLKAHDPHEAHGAKPSRNPLVRFQRGFERRFEALRSIYRSLLIMAMGASWRFVAGFLVVVAVSFALAPYLGQNFFPPVQSPQIKLHVRAPTGTRIEQTAKLVHQVEDVLRDLVPPHGIESIVDNIGMPISGINVAYGNSGTIGVEDTDILVTLANDLAPRTRELVNEMRAKLPAAFPGTSFAFLPADIVSQILNFGLPAPIDVQVIGNKAKENRAYADRIYRKIARVPGIADARIQQVFNNPTMAVNVDRSFASQIGLTEQEVTRNLQVSLAGSMQTQPTFWLNPKTGVSYPISVQTPQYWIKSMSDLGNVQVDGANGVMPLAAAASFERGATPAIVSHYNVQPTIDIYATTHGRDLGAVAADIQKVLDETARDVPPGSTVVLRGQVTTMTAAYTQLIEGLALAVVLIYLLIVVNFQSWLDPFVIVSALPAALAGIVWMLFLSHTTLSVPALTGAIMCMGVATANSILVVSFAREQLASGLSPLDAAIEAGFTRFRPVLMTALAMIIGMLPMSLSVDQNAPLGRAVIGGLICSTIATLLFVPVVFKMVHARSGTTEKDAEPTHGALAAHA